MYITATGMVCSVGLTADSACAAMRAGIASFEELPYLDNQGEPIIGAMVPGLPGELKRSERLGDMLALSVADCLKNLKNIENLDRIPMLLGLAEPDRPGGGAGFAGAIISRMVQKLGVRFHPQLSKVIQKGHTSGFEGLRIARELLQNQDVSACLICGVDSYVNASSLLWLDQYQRLKTLDNSDGVIPGEGAAALIVTNLPINNGTLPVRLAGLGFAIEEATVLNDVPMLGIGLTEAAQSALLEADLQYHQIDVRLSDVTGESYSFREQALVEGRLLRVRKDEMPIWHSADCIGDTGAASGVGQICISKAAIIKHYTPGSPAICFTSSVGGERAVAIVKCE